MQHGVYVKKINGNIKLLSDEGEKIIKEEEKLKVNNKYEIILDKNSYANISHETSPESREEGFLCVLFPDSNVKVLTGRGTIKEIEIVNGIVFAPSILKVKIPFAEFIDYPFSTLCCIEVVKNEKVIVTNGRAVIMNKKTKKSVQLENGHQVIITENSISNEIAEQRYKELMKIFERLYAFEGQTLYKNISNKSDELMQATLYVNKILAQKTGQDFKKIENEIINDFDKYKKWASQNVDEMEEVKQNILNKNFNKNCEVIQINKSIIYSEVKIIINNLKIEERDNDMFLSFNITVENNTDKEKFIFWNEEVRFINKDNETILMEDYNIKTDILPQSKNTGYWFTIIRKDDKIRKIQFGKKSMKKLELELESN